jgi:hypothetical protein
MIDVEESHYDIVERTLQEDALSENCSFVLCDAIEFGFPLAYVSRGFVELMEYSREDCIGKKCGAVVCRKTMIDDASNTIGLNREECDERAALMSRFVAASCVNALARWPGKQVTSVFVLNQRKGGSLFVCELAICALKHPVLDKFYMIGCQKDASESVSINRLFEAAKDDASFEAFMASQPMSFYELLVHDVNVTFFHSKIEEVWHERARKMLQDINPSLQTPAWQPKKRTLSVHSPKPPRPPIMEDFDDLETHTTCERQTSALSCATSFCLSEWTTVPKENADKATQTERWSTDVLSGAAGTALHRNRPDSAPPTTSSDDVQESNSHGRRVRPPAIPNVFDGVWSVIPDAMRGLPEQWLRVLHIRGTQVTDGTGLSISLLRGPNGRYLLENGVLSLENDILHRDGRSGRRVSFKRMQRPKQYERGEQRVSFR